MSSKPGEKLCTKCGLNTLAIDLETGEQGSGYAEFTPSRQARTEARDKLE